MKKQILVVFAAVMMIAALTSCEKVPQEQIDAAKAAVEDVRMAQADQYVPAEFKALKDSLDAALAEVEVQKSKTFKKFGKVRATLDGVIQKAPQVKANAEAAKERVRVETEQEINNIRALLEENKTLITKAPKGKEGKAALEQINNEMTMIENALGEISTMMENGEYLKAQTRAQAVKQNAININNELKEAIAKVSGKKK